MHLAIDSEGWLRTKRCDKRDDFNFAIVNFLFICSNITAAPPRGLHTSLFLQHSKTCASYHYFLDRGLLLTKKLLNKEFLSLFP